ncbi:MAG TPA: 7-carboxy-7-deazaguanine synthase QueE [Flavobacteriales bacterium]|jgi:7-carboxy-7-deazaguanine synthase|nr:7-carboxy-7-deazaguanine synthase QueE [Flavobacteriales bacterium]
MRYSSKLPVMERFLSIQGEGENTGALSWFIRLAGCDVGCSWCDVKESWQVSDDQYFEVDFLVEEARNSGAKNVVITGGEPCMYQLDTLTEGIRTAGLKTWLETSGSYPITGFWSWICISPKKFKLPIREQLHRADELKIIVANKADLEWAEEFGTLVKNQCRKYVQPEWSKRQKVMQSILDFQAKHSEWVVSIQSHKYLDLP